MKIELVLAPMMSALALIALPRKSVRRRRRGRFASKMRRSFLPPGCWRCSFGLTFAAARRPWLGEAFRVGWATDEEQMERGCVVCDAIYAYCQSQS
jgi:hypothetical protein